MTTCWVRGANKRVNGGSVRSSKRASNAGQGWREQSHTIIVLALWQNSEEMTPVPVAVAKNIRSVTAWSQARALLY